MVIMDTPESISSLEEQAHKRKQRLKNLKRKNPNGDKTINDSSGEIVPLPKPKFRSYKPQDESLKEAKLDDAEPAAVEDEVKDLLEAGKEKHKGMPLKKEEVMRLLNLVECNPIVYSKTTNATSNKLKDAAWVKITYHFNSAINSHPRKPEQLRLKWENLKKNARKRSSNINSNNLKTGFGIPDYIHPDEVLDRVAAILGPTPEALHRQNASHTGDISAEKADDMRTVIVIPSPSDDEEITGAIDCVEIGVDGGAEGEPCCTSGTDDITNIPKHPRTDERNRVCAQRTNGKILHQNLMAKEVESRINRNNAIADYYMAKKMKIDEELILNRQKILLEQKKVELEILELERERDLITDKDKLLLKKKKLDLEILEIQRKKYSSPSTLPRGSTEGM